VGNLSTIGRGKYFLGKDDRASLGRQNPLYKVAGVNQFVCRGGEASGLLNDIHGLREWGEVLERRRRFC